MQNEPDIIVDEIKRTGLWPNKPLCCIYDSVCLGTSYEAVADQPVKRCAMIHDLGLHVSLTLMLNVPILHFQSVRFDHYCSPIVVHQ